MSHAIRGIRGSAAALVAGRGGTDFATSDPAFGASLNMDDKNGKLVSITPGWRRSIDGALGLHRPADLKIEGDVAAVAGAVICAGFTAG